MYLWVKAAHVAAVIVWMAGMFSMTHHLSQPEGVSAEQWRRLRALDASWTVVGMSAAIALGFWMATRARWWIHPWFVAKFCVAMLLAGAHGSLAASLRRRSEESGEVGQRWHRYAPGLLLAAVMLIAVLVMVKPQL